MQNKNNGWKQPEEKFPETELEDSFSGFFSKEEEISVPKGKRRRHKSEGPDILAVSESKQDDGFIIKEVVAVEGQATGKSSEEAPEPENKAEETKEISAEAAEGEPPKQEEPAVQEAAFSDAKEYEEAKANTPVEETLEEQPSQEDKAASEEQSAAVSNDEAPEEKPVKKKKILFPRAKKVIAKKRSHRYVAVVGAVLIALAIVGAISVVSLGVRLVARILDNTNQKEAFEWKIYPVLMLDPATFDDPAQLDDVFLLKTAMWSTLLEHRTIYTYDENGMLLVPASDLDVAAKKLYGDAVTLKHQTFSEEYEYFYLYDEKTNIYSVPVSSQTASYTPKVAKITRDGDIYTLIVGYVEPTTLWTISEDGSFTESVPSKYMYYDLQKVKGGNFILKSVRNIPLEELPSDLETATQQSLNQTQYIDYDEIYQEYLNGQREELPSKQDIESSNGADFGEDIETPASEGN